MTASFPRLRYAASLTALALLPACQSDAEPANADPALEVTIPLTTESETARTHFMAGLDAQDMGRLIDANEHFKLAVESDPSFARGHLEVANTSNSLEEFVESLQHAVDAAATASRSEQLLIDIAKKGLDNDLDGQLAAADELAQVQPESPRSWLALGNVRTGLNRIAEAREAYAKAAELAPDLVAAHIALGNSYLFNDPKDLAQAEAHMQRAVELRPDEPNPYDYLGDVHRAQGQLEKARDDYTMAAERAPADASPIQQRGHVNSFLGDYDAARADYQKSMDMGRSNQAPSFAVYKAFVNVHAGQPQAAIDELKALVTQIDPMNVPGKPSLKVFALNNAVQIALHNGFNDQAAALIAQMATIMRQQADETRSDPIRRGQEAAIAYWEGRLAANRKDFTTASQKADAIVTLLEPDANPRKLEPVHELRGYIALGQGNAAEAVEHFRLGNPSTTYTTYMLAVALERAGQTDEAMNRYAEVANNNFNSVDFALTRKDAQAKAGARQ